LKPFFSNLEKLGESDIEDLEKTCCKFCDEKFFIPADLDFHVRREHQSATENQLFKCLFCSNLAKSEDTYRYHLKMHHKHEGFWCKFRQCAAVFKTEESMAEHLKQNHFMAEGKKPLKCKVCKYWYATKRSLKSHMEIYKKKVHGPNLYKCIFCNNIFASKIILKQHTKENHESEGIKCQHQRCLLYFKTTEEMKEHFENLHRNNCKFCASSFINRTLLLSHLRKVHLDKKCNFSRCIFYTASEEEMKEHLKEKDHKNRKICVYCGKSCTNPTLLIKHVRENHSEIAIRCDHYRCSFFFKRQEDLEEHKKEAHQREKTRKSVVCQFCPKTYADRNPYAVHIKIAHPEVLRCKYRTCFTFFKTEEELQKHNKEKHVENFCCALCDYKAPKRDHIINHIQRHHLPKEVKCPSCPKFFVRDSSLAAHFNYFHQSQKCPHCNETKSDLKRHVVTTLCPTCSQPFPCRKLLFDHKLNCKMVHECLECGEVFKIAHYLKLHVNLRHKSGQKWE